MSEFTEPTEAEVKQLRDEWAKLAEEINKMSDLDIERLVKAGRCPYRPELLKYVPLGMHHCPICGEMVIAAVPHTPSTTFTEQELTELADKSEVEDFPDNPK